MKLKKNSIAVYVLLGLFYTTFVAVLASSITTRIFLNKYFNSGKLEESEIQAMYGAYLEELRAKNREKAFQMAKDKDAELEMYRQSVISRLKLIDSTDRKIYLLKDTIDTLEHEKESIKKD